MLTNSGDYFDIGIEDSAKVSVWEGRCGLAGDEMDVKEAQVELLSCHNASREMRSHQSASAVREKVVIHRQQCQLGYYVGRKEEGI